MKKSFKNFNKFIIFLQQLKIDFGFVGIDPDQLDFHPVANGKFPSRMSPAQAVAALIKFVIIIGDAGNMDQTLHGVVQLDKQAEGVC